MQNILDSENINSGDLAQLLELRKEKKIDFVLADIREQFETAEGYIEGCDLFTPTSNFTDFIPEFEKSKDKNIVLYCRSGGRSGQVKSFLKEEGFEKISHLSGGISSYFGSIIR